MLRSGNTEKSKLKRPKSTTYFFLERERDASPPYTISIAGIYPRVRLEELLPEYCDLLRIRMALVGAEKMSPGCSVMIAILRNEIDGC